VKYQVKCKTPYCKNTIVLAARPKFKDYNFCDECKKEHSLAVLQVQADLKLPIKDALLDASLFKNAASMGDYMGISFVSVYSWIRKYFSLSFQEFRRIYICKSSKCYLLDISRSSYSRNDYILKKLRSNRYCACINALEKDHIMTNAPVGVVSQILRGSPRIVRVSDTIFSLAPQPIKFNCFFPVYFSDSFKIPKISSV
jgi:hypothetical protein